MTDELEAIHKRHEADDKVRQYTGFLDAPTALRASRQAHTDRATLLRLLDAAREELREVGKARGGMLIDADERTTVRIFTPYAPPSPGAITGIRKAADPCSDCIDGWCQMNCGPRVG